MTDHIPEVLFVCVHNAGRSQMAAALLAHHAGDRVVVRSAGTAPARTINPAVAAAMSEIGIDLVAAGASPKRLTDSVVAASDVVITMGCGDECPFYPGKRYLDWPVDDPAGLDVEAIRPIRDAIDRRVRALLSELLPQSVAPIACTLTSDAIDGRLVDWQAMLGHAISRAPIMGGLRITFAPTVPVSDLVRLAADEYDCCRFFEFAITIDGRGIALEVRAPDDAISVVEALFGTPP